MELNSSKSDMSEQVKNKYRRSYQSDTCYREIKNRWGKGEEHLMGDGKVPFKRRVMTSCSHQDQWESIQGRGHSEHKGKALLQESAQRCEEGAGRLRAAWWTRPELGETLWPVMLHRKDLIQQTWDCSLGRACLQGWPLTDIWELGFGEGSQYPN